MHDWKQIVRTSLGNLRVDQAQEEDIVGELASHLEELYDELRGGGFSEQEATKQCQDQLVGARHIAAAIERTKRKEGVMNRRSRILWLPGLVTLTLASVCLMGLQLLAFSPPGISWVARIPWVDSRATVVGGIWLIALPFCGAAGAYLSLRGGGTRFNSLAAALFPSIVMLGVFCLVLPVAILIERNTFIIHHPLYFGLALMIWVVIPGAVLLLGALTVWKIKDGPRQDFETSSRRA